ncbi:uncharacterized protein LOC103569820 [Microplitis demolitor]|uniref:uncharacterized protein LOC103569820 n=1 Tax=Microplitis demolitor TaxID=69319 RepID=UPI0004CD890D|nr:uncharacterized protein LOC103569820 [Microplitis demolitor]
MNQFIFILLFYNCLNVNFAIGHKHHYSGGYRGSNDRRETESLDLLGLRKKLLQDNDNNLGKIYNDRTEDTETDPRSSQTYDLEHWTGKWMPENDPEPTPVPEINSDNNVNMGHSLPMGKIAQCDDGKNYLEVDWDNSPINHTCFGRKIIPSNKIYPDFYCEHIPKYYSARHACMNEKIEYYDEVPMYGTHRPVWPVYGEYKFVPKQRWIHSLEHGAVVMLYHPCANKNEINLLRKIVTQCLRRHIITPYTELDQTRPLALVTWGCRLTMSYVNPSLVKEFIRTKALHGAEAISKDGDFDEGLIRKAKVVSDEDDSNLCPSDSNLTMM